MPSPPWSKDSGRLFGSWRKGPGDLFRRVGPQTGPRWNGRVRPVASMDPMVGSGAAGPIGRGVQRHRLPAVGRRQALAGWRAETPAVLGGGLLRSFDLGSDSGLSTPPRNRRLRVGNHGPR